MKTGNSFSPLDSDAGESAEGIKPVDLIINERCNKS